MMKLVKNFKKVECCHRSDRIHTCNWIFSQIMRHQLFSFSFSSPFCELLSCASFDSRLDSSVKVFQGKQKKSFNFLFLCSNKISNEVRWWWCWWVSDGFLRYEFGSDLACGRISIGSKPTENIWAVSFPRNPKNQIFSVNENWKIRLLLDRCLHYIYLDVYGDMLDMLACRNAKMKKKLYTMPKKTSFVRGIFSLSFMYTAKSEISRKTSWEA